MGLPATACGTESIGLVEGSRESIQRRAMEMGKALPHGAVGTELSPRSSEHGAELPELVVH